MASYLRSRLKSIGYALEGLGSLIRSEKNMWIHLAATIVVIIAGILRHIDRHDWSILIIAIAGVWITEAINTAIEKLSNVVSPEIHPVIKQAKDISAAAVLIAAIIALILGAFVFLG
jgi:diacylglycerol kinase